MTPDASASPAARAPTVFVQQIERWTDCWVIHVWTHDHVEFFGLYRWRWLAAWMSRGIVSRIRKGIPG